MRPLNRPMFRYGGPIKEGVMSGIREPKKNGGSMREAQQWNTVGSPAFPKDSSGRAHHLLPAWLAWTGLSAAARAAAPTVIRAAGSAAARRTAQEAATKAALSGGGKKIIEKGIPAAATGWKNLFKNYWSGDPAVKGSKWTWKTLTSPGANTLAQKTVRGLLSPSSLALTGGLTWYMWPDGTKRKNPPPGGTGGNTGGPQHPSNNPDLYGGLKTAEDAAKAKLAAEKLRKDRIQKYRDIVDIKGMNSEAAAKSLIEASRLINESQDFKGDIRSGKLINRIIQGTSKAYDKPADMRRAIDTLILKGEIQKDIAGAKGTAAFQAIDALASASGKSHKYVANQKLGIPNTVGEAVAQLKKIKGLQTTSDDVATQVYSFSEQSGVPVQKHITTEQKNELIGKDKKYSSLTEMISKEKFTEDGYYIIGTSVFEVVDGVPRIKG